MHVVPIAFEDCDISLRRVKYKRRQVPLRLCTASTVHTAQGRTVKQHVMVPAPADHAAGFARSLAYTALSRGTSLEGLCLTAPLLPRHFTRYEQQYQQVQWELGSWRGSAP